MNSYYFLNVSFLLFSNKISFKKLPSLLNFFHLLSSPVNSSRISRLSFLLFFAIHYQHQHFSSFGLLLPQKKIFFTKSNFFEPCQFLEIARAVQTRKFIFLSRPNKKAELCSFSVFFCEFWRFACCEECSGFNLVETKNEKSSILKQKTYAKKDM
jgi:hypothetical protein